jgi:hypothetical protein
MARMISLRRSGLTVSMGRPAPNHPERCHRRMRLAITARDTLFFKTETLLATASSVRSSSLAIFVSGTPAVVFRGSKQSFRPYVLLPSPEGQTVVFRRSGLLVFRTLKSVRLAFAHTVR